MLIFVCIRKFCLKSKNYAGYLMGFHYWYHSLYWKYPFYFQICTMMWNQLLNQSNLVCTVRIHVIDKMVLNQTVWCWPERTGQIFVYVSLLCRGPDFLIFMDILLQLKWDKATNGWWSSSYALLCCQLCCLRNVTAEVRKHICILQLKHLIVT